MKHNLLKSLIISVILLMGVSNAWGKTSFYLNATSAWDKDGAKFSIYYTADGTNWYFSEFMSKISGDFYTVTIDRDNIKTIVAVRHNSSASSPTWDNDNKWNQTSNIDISTNKHNHIKITAQGNGDATCTTQTHGFNNIGDNNGIHNIYFDNTITQWENVYLRVGTGAPEQSAKGYCQAYEMQKVPGTANLYKHQLEKWLGYTDFNFANNWGWQGNNNIYQPWSIYNDSYKMTGQTTYYTLSTSYGLWNNDLYIPTTKDENPTHECYDYSMNDRDQYTNEVTFSNYKGGTVTISYTNENGQTINKTDGSFSVPQTCILTVESAVAAPGYEFRNVEFYNSITKQGDIKTRGETFIVRDARTIYPEFVTTSPQKVFLKINAAWEDYKHIKVYTWNNNSHLWVDLNPVNGVSNLFSCEIPAGYSQLSFVKLNGEDAGGYHWNHKTAQSLDLNYTPVSEGKNCFKLTTMTKDDGGNDKYTGEWVGATITAKSTGSSGNNTIGIGRYGIKYNGETRYATTTQDAKFDVQVPYGENIEITALKGEPGNEAYTGYLIMNDIDTIYFSNGATDTLMNINVTRDIEFDDFFVTKEPHIVYLGVPEGVKYSWQNGDDTNKSIAYAEHQYNTSRGAICLQEISTTKNGTTYYKFTIPAGWNNFRFELKEDGDHNRYNTMPIHATIRFPYGIPTDENNCFTLTGKEGYEFQGTWGKAPQCQVEMGYTNIGRYGIKDYNNTIHYAIPGVTNTIFYVPYGTQVEVLEGEPGNNAYNGMVGLFNGNNVVKKFHDGQNQDNFVTITGYTMFDDLFVSKAPHEVYLGVPNEGFDNWRLNDGERMTVRHLWPRDYIPSEYVNYEEMFVIDDITYYKFTLPAGIYKFQFSHRQNDSQISASRHFPYQIPVTEYNCFILENRQDGNLDYDGYWTKLPKPTNVGDYRLLYAEKELVKTHEEGEAEDWETAFRTVYSHPSDIITKPTQTVSLHINTNQTGDRENIHPMVILQQFKKISTDTYQWVDIEAHTVLPLTARGNMAMLPGRKKAYGDLPFYSDGIDNITNDTTYQSRLGGQYKGSGVWNFTVMLGVDNVNLNLDDVKRYKGPYYIRTEALPDDGWNNYTGNLMTYSDYADYNSGFSHYFCKWLLVGNNVKFTIANDYAQSISDPLYGDATDLWGEPINYQMVERDQVLNEDANVRFAWYEMNNFVHRAYLSGSTHVQDRFLVVKGEAGEIFSHPQGTALPAGENGTPRFGLDADEEIFRDDANWIYHADIQIKPGCIANVTAQHFGKTQTFIKNRTLVYGEDLDDMKNKYPIRLLYDFKINRLITGYIPNGDNNTEIEAFTTDLMLIRREEPNDEDSKVTQLVFNTKAMDNSNTRAYGVLELSKERLVNDGNYNDLKRRLYWISFPFDVRITDVFGSGIYAQHWIIQSYNGQKRADNGYYYETTESNWEYHFDPNTINKNDPEYRGVLKKGVGYVVALNLYNIWKDQLLDNTKDAICLYFPSKDLISADIVKDQDITIEVPGHKCEKKGREIADSHWNVIGVPAYKNAGAEFNQPIDLSTDCPYYYRWDKAHNAYTPMAGSTREFSTLHAYMVQYHGGLNWKGVVREGTQSLAARSNTDHQIEHNLRLELQKDGKELDRTFVRLQENEDDVTSGFDFNYDLSKIINAGTNIYTIVKTNDLTTNVSGNVLPLAEDMVIPVGVVIDQAGEYTFSMPDGTDGIIAELIDYQTNTRTNLLLDNYTVTLPAGTNNSRFALSLQPDKTVTSVDNIGNEATGDKVKKYLIDGKLYLQKDGVLYDAQGHAL